MLEWVPELITHLYWNKKEKFQLEQDTYLTWVLFGVEEGRFEYRIGSEYGEAGFGDLVVCPPHIAFQRNALAPLSFHAFTFSFADDENQSLLAFMSDRKVHVTQTERLLGNYEQLRLADQSLNWNLNIQRLKYHYFLDLWLLYANWNRKLMDTDSFVVDDELIRDVVSYLNRHAHEKIEIRQVAARFDLTPVHLIRRFKRAYKMNPLQYLTSIRMKKACRLLLATEWNLDTIAENCGYENGFYLSRIFSRLMGLSPSAFRKQNHF